MKFKERTGNEVLDGGKEDLNVSVGDDICAQKLVLRKDIARLVIVAAPSMEGFSGTVSTTTR